MEYDKYKIKVQKEVERRGLTSVLNDTRWNRLLQGIYKRLPFAPPFQMKDVLEELPYPEYFEQDVNYNGDWHAAIGDMSDDARFTPLQNPALRIKPRRLEYQGRLVESRLLDIEQEFVTLLREERIPYVKKGNDYWIYGYATAEQFAEIHMDS